MEWLGALLIAAIVTTGTVMYSTQQQKKKASESRKEQTEAARGQAIQAGRQAAIANYPISAEQMKMYIGQREIDNLVKKFDEQDRTEPEIYTLPASEPTNPIERINQAIGDLFRK